MSKPTAAAEKKRVQTILRRLRRAYPDAEGALHHRNAYELLVATILSAQCTDEAVNKVTPALFARYPTPAALAAAPRADVEALVRSTGFFRNKAKNIQGAAQVLIDRFGGDVPRAMDDLLSLPGRRAQDGQRRARRLLRTGRWHRGGHARAAHQPAAGSHHPGRPG
jgi:endonuclease-3